MVNTFYKGIHAYVHKSVYIDYSDSFIFLCAFIYYMYLCMYMPMCPRVSEYMKNFKRDNAITSFQGSGGCYCHGAWKYLKLHEQKDLTF